MCHGLWPSFVSMINYVKATKALLLVDRWLCIAHFLSVIACHKSQTQTIEQNQHNFYIMLLKIALQSSVISPIFGAASSTFGALTSQDLAASANLSFDESESSHHHHLRRVSSQAECFFASQDSSVDIGALGCEHDEVCVADASSSMGGRCHLYSERKLTFDSAVGIACTFADGTAGIKCKGNANTCKDVTDFSKIGCGSCIGSGGKFENYSILLISKVSSCVDIKCKTNHSM